MPIMPTRKNPAALEGNRVHLRPPRQADQRAFIAQARNSRPLHGAWVQPPDSPTAFAAYVTRYGLAAADARNVGFLVIRSEDDTLAGAVNFSEIIRGGFQSAYVGYYAFAPFAGGGYMGEALACALDFVFLALKLHRIEANVQPANSRSIALAERVGFTREGYSRRYVKIAGRWRDHLRFAILAEDWKKHRLALRAQRALAASRG
jgi:[ribosomal protein S5]-alanine N-acetyltransferase